MRRNGRRAARISVFLSVVVWIVFLQGLALAQVVLRNQPVSSTLNHNNETTIAINPSDTLNLIGGTIVQGTNAGPLGYFWSIDGGVSWSANEQFSVGSEQLTDPVVAFDGHGVAYYVYLRKHDGIFLHKSTNGGQSWPGYRRPVLTTQMTVDKPWLAISPIMNQSNQHDISVVFIENDPLGLNGIHVWEGFSSDSGATFSNSRLTESSDFFGGPSVAFGPDNKRYFVWARLDNSTPSRTTHIWFMPSGGESTPITSVNQAGVVDQVSQRYVLKSSKVRVTSYPSIDVDRSEGSRRGWIYVTWTDGETPDVLLIKSTD